MSGWIQAAMQQNTISLKNPKRNNINRLQIVQRVPALRAFWDLEKTVLHQIRVSGTVVSPLLA